jgi:hypothetical protein
MIFSEADSEVLAELDRIILKLWSRSMRYTLRIKIYKEDGARCKGRLTAHIYDENYKTGVLWAYDSRPSGKITQVLERLESELLACLKLRTQC